MMAENELLSAQNLLPKIHLQWFASAEDEGRTEDPSEHKLRKAREEGRIPKSQELTGGLVLLLPVLTLILLAPWLLRGCVQIIRFYMDRCTTASITDGELLMEFLYAMVRMVLPITATAVVAGITANVIQNKGFIFTTKTIEPKMSKILPKFGEYFKKTLFSFEGAFNVVKSIVKVAVIFIAAYLLIRSETPQLISLMNTNFWDGVVFIAETTAKLLIITSIIFIIIAIPDYIVQKKQFMESMKMTKQEVKQEYKELEGDPLVKGRLRQYMHEMLRRNIPAAVAKSDVVITNPTHYAVAIQYDSTTMAGPMVMAKGVDALARRIREIATENRVPLVENRPLARALYAEVEIGEMVPENYYQALAVILANVYNTKGK